MTTKVPKISTSAFCVAALALALALALVNAGVSLALTSPHAAKPASASTLEPLCAPPAGSPVVSGGTLVPKRVRLIIGFQQTVPA